MAIRNIIEYSDPSLRRKSRPVEKFDARMRELLDDLAETMYASEGVGLAAPQVGVLRRAIVVDALDGLGLLVCGNPRLISAEGEQDGPEGCLSIPGRQGYVVRPQRVTVAYQDREGNEQTVTAEGYRARALCHEMDHLDGQLFIDIMHDEIEVDEDGE